MKIKTTVSRVRRRRGHHDHPGRLIWPITGSIPGTLLTQNTLNTQNTSFFINFVHFLKYISNIQQIFLTKYKSRRNPFGQSHYSYLSKNNGLVKLTVLQRQMKQISTFFLQFGGYLILESKYFCWIPLKPTLILLSEFDCFLLFY